MRYSRRLLLLVTASILLSVGSLIAVDRLGLIDIDPIDADIKGDWVVTRAAWDGTGAHLDPNQLSVIYGVDYRYDAPIEGATVASPRTPGALLIQGPLLLVPYGSLYQAAFWATVMLIVLVAVGAVRLFALPFGLLVLAIPLALVARPSLFAYRFSSQAALISVLILLVFLGTRDQDKPWAGIALAVAGSLKVFPLLLLVPLILRKRYVTAGWCAGTVLALTVGGLLLPGVSLGQSIAAIADAGETWFSSDNNASLAAFVYRLGMGLGWAQVLGPTLGLAILALYLTVARTRSTPLHADLTFALMAALLVSPLVWTHYLVTLYGSLIWMSSSARDSRISAVSFAIGLFLLVPAAIPEGIDTMTVLVFVLALFAWMVLSDQSTRSELVSAGVR